MSVPSAVSVLAVLTQARLGELSRGLGVSIPAQGTRMSRTRACSTGPRWRCRRCSVTCTATRCAQCVARPIVRLSRSHRATLGRAQPRQTRPSHHSSSRPALARGPRGLHPPPPPSPRGVRPRRPRPAVLPAAPDRHGQAAVALFEDTVFERLFASMSSPPPKMPPPLAAPCRPLTATKPRGKRTAKMSSNQRSVFDEDS
jgi:hypothetical protein